MCRFGSECHVPFIHPFAFSQLRVGNDLQQQNPMLKNSASGQPELDGVKLTDSEATVLTLIDTMTRKVIEVIVVESPSEAVRIYRERKEKIDCHIRTPTVDRLILAC